MIHGQHRVLLDDAVVLRQVLLSETRLVARAAERLAEQFALPVGCRRRRRVFGVDAGDDEWHFDLDCCGYVCVYVCM